MEKKTSGIRVLIVDDHEVVREGIRSILEGRKDVTVIGEAVNGQQAIDMSRDLQPDIVLMDISMPVMSGLEATRIIKEKNPDINILILTIHEDDRYFFNILKAGASGYFIKGGTSAELISALYTIHEGHVFLYPTMVNKLLVDYLKRTEERGTENGFEKLTSREKEILQLVAEDLSNQEIASRLGLSPATVQTHRSNIMAKLQLHSRTELTKYAIKHGLIKIDILD